MPVMSKPGFWAKTDSGLRRLLPAEDLWNWGKEQNSGKRTTAGQTEHRVPDAAQHSFPSASQKYPCTRHPPDPEKAKPERPFLRNEGKCQEKPLKTTDDKAEPEPLTEYTVQKQSHQYLQETSDSFEKGSSNPSSEDESSSSLSSSSSSSSSSGGPIRVRSLPNSPDGSWTSHKSIESFASLPEFQRAAAICINISEVSISSSDIEEDLPYDSENIKWKLSDLGRPADLETTVGPCSKICMGVTDCKIEAMSNTATCYAGNRLLQNVASDNKNQENSSLGAGEYVCLSPPTHSGVDKIHKVCECTEQARWPLIPGAGNRGKSHESSSGDDGLSEAEEKSEVFSHSSEGLASSEEEIILNNQLGTTEKNCRLDHSDKGQRGIEGSLLNPEQSMDSRRKQLSLNICSQFGMLEKNAFREKSGTIRTVDGASWKTIFSEETLSEILSPVDEVLSYGSTELPPSIVGATGSNNSNYLFLHPPPASEIITWTSEEDFPPPPEDVDEVKPDKSPAEDPSIRSEDLPSLSEDLIIPINKDELDEQTERKIGYECLKADLQVTDYETSSCDHEQTCSNDKNLISLLALSTADVNDEFLDPLSSFRIGDRVLVCCLKRGVLKFKGKTSFACGYWAGVALDSPTGNHNGTFQGIQYFKCDNNYGVLVRAEEVSHLPTEEESDLETRVDDDPFSDEEPSSSVKPNHEGIAEVKFSEDKLYKKKNEGQELLEDNFSAPRNACRDAHLLEEMNNNPLQSITSYSDQVLILEPLSLSSLIPSKSIFNDQVLESSNETAVLSEHFSLPDFDETLKCKKDCQKNNKQTWNTPIPSSQRGREDLEVLGVDKRQPDPISLKLYACHVLPVRTPAHNNDPAFYISQETSVGSISKCHHDVDSFVEALVGHLIKEVIMETQMIMRKHRRVRSSVQDENHNLDLNLKKREGNHYRADQLGFSDQWHGTIPTAAKPEITVQAHDSSIVHRLVGAAVEKLCGQTVSYVVSVTDAPHHLVNEESCKAYQKVICDLTSDVFHEIVGGHLKISDFSQKKNLPLSLSILQTSKATFTNVKAMVQTEVRRVLNLERNDLHVRKMFQKMCKYGKAQRDKVDYILVQELHKEEPQWVDYSHDQLTVKSRIAEEIFEILLQDTISVLKHIYLTPPNSSPPAVRVSPSMFK
ncbi:hypothetical protein GN956_G19438 [Arapaima gigas]